jgi:hypothetical protein
MTMKKFVLSLIAVTTLAATVQGQVAISNLGYTQDFNSIGSGLPTGWDVRIGATASGLGSAARSLRALLRGEILQEHLKTLPPLARLMGPKMQRLRQIQRTVPWEYGSQAALEILARALTFISQR